MAKTADILTQNLTGNGKKIHLFSIAKAMVILSVLFDLLISRKYLYLLAIPLSTFFEQFLHNFSR